MATRLGTAIHDRNFRTVSLGDNVFDPGPVQGGEHMLGGGNRRVTVSPSTAANSVAVTERKSAMSSRRAGPSVQQEENDATIGLGGMKSEGNRRTGMDAERYDGRVTNAG